MLILESNIYQTCGETANGLSKMWILRYRSAYRRTKAKWEKFKCFVEGFHFRKNGNRSRHCKKVLDVNISWRFFSQTSYFQTEAVWKPASDETVDLFDAIIIIYAILFRSADIFDKNSDAFDAYETNLSNGLAIRNADAELERLLNTNYEPAEAWKKITTGYIKWIYRYLGECNNYQNHIDRFTKVNMRLNDAFYYLENLSG